MTSPTTQTNPPQGAALYIHWPFCKKKCPYCDFNSHVRDGVDHAAWRAALQRELGYWQARVPEAAITSVFFGGGTPSLMEPETVAALIADTRALWPATGEIEITLEANPTSVEAEKFRAMREAGVNRVSLGVQSLRSESLAFLGREHSANEARDAIALAAEIFPRYSFDLIYALPGQTAEQWETELREALTLARGHLSLYQLTIEENTAFHHAYHVAKAFSLPAESQAADLYALTNRLMAEAGLPAYEISNYAAAGHASLHNLSYWRGDMYFGIGPGAHGRVNLGAARMATNTLKSPERWLDAVQHAGHGIEEETALTLTERAEEKVLMGLRLVQEGLRYDRLRDDERDYLLQLWSDGRVQPLVALGLLETSIDGLKATVSGQLVLNEIIQQLLR